MPIILTNSTPSLINHGFLWMLRHVNQPDSVVFLQIYFLLLQYHKNKNRLGPLKAWFWKRRVLVILMGLPLMWLYSGQWAMYVPICNAVTQLRSKSITHTHIHTHTHSHTHTHMHICIQTQALYKPIFFFPQQKSTSGRIWNVKTETLCLHCLQLPVQGVHTHTHTHSYTHTYHPCTITQIPPSYTVYNVAVTVFVFSPLTIVTQWSVAVENVNSLKELD